MSGKSRRLPDGTIRVVDADTYCDTWASWAAPLVSATGWQVLGYDPGYLFDAGDHTVTLASEDVRRLVDLIRGGQ